MLSTFHRSLMLLNGKIAGRLVAAVALTVASPPLGRAAAYDELSAQHTVDNTADKSRNVDKADDASNPDLIALTWQHTRTPNGKRIKQPVWRPDGTRLTDAETNELLDQVKSFQNHWWNQDQLRPLVLVFRRDSPIKSGVSAAIVLPDGRRLWGGTWAPVGSKGLMKSACAPQLRELPKWPESVDLDVKVPLEDPQIIKTIKEITDVSIDVAPGVRWYIDPNRGIDFQPGGKRREHLKAAVLEVEDERPESLVFYQSNIWLRDQKQPLSGGYVTMVGRDTGVFVTLRVSKPLEGVGAIERVEVTQQRFKMQRLSDIKLRVDLLPPPSVE